MLPVCWKFTYNDKRPMKSIVTEEERILNRLESDRIGVIVDVLIKHAKIKCVDEIYKRVCGSSESTFCGTTA